MSNVYTHFNIDTWPKNQKKLKQLGQVLCLQVGLNMENFVKHIHHIFFITSKKRKEATEAREEMR